MFNYGCGGAETVLLNFLKFNKTLENPWNITVFALNNSGILFEDFKKYATILSFEPIKNKKINNIILRIVIKSRILTNFCIFKNQEFDSAIAWLEGVPAKIVKNINKAKNKIAWIHTDINHFDKKTKLRYERIYKGFSRIAFVSSDIKNKFQDIYPKLNNKEYSVIYNPIDFEAIKQKSYEEQIDFVKTNLLTVISVGRFTFEKGMDRIVQIAKKCMDENLAIQFILIGDGPELTNLKKIATDFQLNNLVFLGYKKNPFPYIDASDLYLLPSRREGYPTCLCEALALEKPIIASNCTGVKEVLENSGILIDNEDSLFIEETVKILQHYLDKPKDLLNLQQSSKERLKGFDYKKQMSIIREYIGR